MKKIITMFVCMLFIISLSGCGKITKSKVLKNFEKKVNNAKGYQVEAQMQLINNEDSYDYDITVSYKKDNKYRVSLRNKINNHEQIILKNEDGVYVLSPRLNKSFKFQSKWPYNSSQSYIIQSILSDMKNDKSLKMSKLNDNYIFKCKVNYKNNPNLKYQEITLDKNFNIKSIVVYDKDDNPSIKVKIKSCDMKAKFDNSYFKLEENIETSEEVKTEDKASSLEEAVYPMYLPENTYLDSEKTVELDNGSRIILTFRGDSSFMLVEESVSKNNEMQIIPTSGELELFAQGIAIIEESSVSFINGDTQYYLVSSDIKNSELITVAKSMSLMPVGK